MPTLVHKERVVTALVLLLVVIAALSLGSWLLTALVLLVGLIAMWEFLSLFWPGTRRILTKLLTIIWGLAFIYAASGMKLYGVAPPSLAGVAAVLFGLTALAFLFSYGIMAYDFDLKEFSPILLAFAYICLPLYFIFGLSTAEQVLVLVATIATDTGGFYVGSIYGRHKIWRSVSPNKSWEGFAGGMLTCVVFTLGMAALFSPGFVNLFSSAGVENAENTGIIGKGLPDLSFVTWLCLGVFLNLAAQFGDFFESALKRSLSVKDSGSLLPGHGGILDRIDGLLFVIPSYLAFKYLYFLI